MLSVRRHAPIQGDAEETLFTSDQWRWIEANRDEYPDLVDALLVLRLETSLSHQLEGLGSRG